MNEPTKSITQTLRDLEIDRQALVGQISTLDSEFRSIAFNVARGDGAAKARQDEIAAELQSLKLRLPTIDAAIAQGKPLLERELRADEIETLRATLTAVEKGLANRRALAVQVDDLVNTVGVLARMLVKSYEAAWRACTAGMTPEERLSIGIDESYVLQHVIGGVLRAGRFDPALLNNLSPLGVDGLSQMPPTSRTITEQNAMLLGVLQSKIVSLEVGPFDPSDFGAVA